MNRLIQIFCTIVVWFPFIANAKVHDPKPSIEPEEAFNVIIGSGSAGNVAGLIKGVTAAVAFIITAWALTDAFDAVADEQISQKGFISLVIRSMTMLSVLIILINL